MYRKRHDVTKAMDNNYACFVLAVQLCNLLDYSPPSSSVHAILGQEYWGGLLSPPAEGLLASGVQSVAPALAGAFLLARRLGSPDKDESCYLLCAYMSQLFNTTKQSRDCPPILQMRKWTLRRLSSFPGVTQLLRGNAGTDWVLGQDGSKAAFFLL